MSNKYRIFTMIVLAIGLAITVLSQTDLCNFGGCTEAHLYRLFGISFPVVGYAFFLSAFLLISLARRLAIMDLLFSLLLAGAAGAEMNMILLQKNVIHAWCPLCLGIAAIVYLLTVCQLCRQLVTSKEGSLMFQKSVYRPVMMVAAALLGFTLTFSAIAKPAASAGQLNLYMGKQESKLEIYLFSDWLCPNCLQVEGVIESQYPALAKKARILFVDKIIHPEAANFVPYHLSFAAYDKDKYIPLRKALFAVAQKTGNPTFDDIKAAIAPLHVTYKQLGFLEVTQQMAAFQKLAEQFKVTATPTMVIRNARSGKFHNLVGSAEITPDRIAKAIKELE